MATRYRSMFSVAQPTFTYNLDNYGDSDSLLSSDLFYITSDFYYFEITASKTKNHGFTFDNRWLDGKTSDTFLTGLTLHYLSDGTRPHLVYYVNGSNNFKRANELSNWSSNPGCPQRFGIAFNNQKLILYFIMSSTVNTYNLTFNYVDSVKSKISQYSKFRLRLNRNNTSSTGVSSMGNVTAYFTPETWMKNDTGYSQIIPIIEDDTLKQY